MGQILTGLEYENLVTALKLALDAQVSILNLYWASIQLLGYYTGPDVVGLELGQSSSKSFGSYPM